MKEKLLALWTTLQQKVSTNREVIIRTGAVVIGTAIGVIGATIVSNMQEEAYINDLLSEDQDEEDDSESQE